MTKFERCDWPVDILTHLFKFNFTGDESLLSLKLLSLKLLKKKTLYSTVCKEDSVKRFLHLLEICL